MSQVGSKVHEFRLIIEGVDDWTDDLMDRLFEAGCDDATFATTCGIHHAVFHREAPSYIEAVASATEALEGVGLTVVDIEAVSPSGA